jgi:tetratricopeptide (TPR) repeat protein
MSIPRLCALWSVSLVLAACCSMPKWLGGREGCDLFMSNLASPNDRGVVLGLCSSGDEDSERGIVELRIGEYEAASKRFKAAVAAFPEPNANAMYLYAVSLERLGKYEEAKDAYLAVLKVSVETRAEEGKLRAERKHARWSHKP